MSDSNILVQTKGGFKVRGIVTGLSKEKAYSEGTVKNGKFKGNKYRSIRFGVKTSPVNTVYVELYGMEQDTITVYRREDKEKNITEDKKTIPFEKRANIPAGYEIVNTTFKLESSEEGEDIVKHYVQYDAVKYIQKTLKDGDSVYMQGNTEYSKYVDATGKERQQKRNNIRSIYREEAIDFTAEDFRELAAFEQEIVFVGSEVEGEKVFVTGRTIAYGGNFLDVQFVIDPQDDEELQKTATAFEKYLSFGDLLKINGNIVNRVERVEEEEPASTGLFGNKSASGYGKRPIRTTVTEMQIIGVDEASYEAGQGKYTEEDFQVKEFIVRDEEKQKSSDNPFEIQDDDLPF
ncbi:single-stranded DNA-binding protein [Paenibacillus sp. LBL]|uniref:hypothetical protein n=1 Tax=Paenibacillus sp. LBL TaxID=2940563 RepID=UPI002474A0BD|nr:hypothetical protein [Paenibacillus sp. LBL]MDH6674321.1 single-stranded DNA-binding protein [Paenibacillus sp. LBL]